MAATPKSCQLNAERIGDLRDDIKKIDEKLNDVFTKSDFLEFKKALCEKEKDQDKDIKELERWRNYIGGGLVVVGLIVTWLAAKFNPFG